MTKIEFIEGLNKIYIGVEELENQPVNELARSARDVAYDLGKLITEFEDNGITEDKSDDE